MSDQPLKELDALMAETVEAAQARESTALDAAVGPCHQSIVLHGAGLWGKRFARRLQEEGIGPLAFSDNNASRWGQSLEGIPILAPAEAARRYGKEAAFVVTISNGYHSQTESHRQLGELGCTRIVPGMFMAWKYGATMLPHFWEDLPSRVLAHKDEIRQAYQAWSDAASRREFVAQLRWRLTADHTALGTGPFWEPESYFPPSLFDLLAEEVMLDGGAYDGDTIRDFLEKRPGFKGRLLAFEPDPGNRAKLERYRDALPPAEAERITVVPRGMWDKEEILRFRAQGDMESFIDPTGDIEIPTVAIDAFCEQHAIVPTLIKMDLQGAEPQALEGAKKMIARHSPLLALSVYHRFDDLWRIPNFCLDLDPTYRLVLWPRMHEGWEMLMFGIPTHRVK
jgi:FkbM family methyltransferase